MSGRGRERGDWGLKNITSMLQKVMLGNVQRFKVWLNPYQLSFALHIETNGLILAANQMTGFYIKCST